MFRFRSFIDCSATKRSSQNDPNLVLKILSLLFCMWAWSSTAAKWSYKVGKFGTTVICARDTINLVILKFYLLEGLSKDNLFIAICNDTFRLTCVFHSRCLVSLQHCCKKLDTANSENLSLLHGGSYKWSSLNICAGAQKGTGPTSTEAVFPETERSFLDALTTAASKSISFFDLCVIATRSLVAMQKVDQKICQDNYVAWKMLFVFLSQHRRSL